MLRRGHRGDVGVGHYCEHEHPLHDGDDQMSKLVGIRAGCQLPHLGRVPAVPGHPQKYRSSCARVSDPAKRP